MKRIILIATFLLISTLTFAQGHLTFKKIPIDGTTTQFLAKLKADGFQQVGTDNDGVWLVGKFVGQQCTVLVQSSPVSHTVYAVYALFQNRSDWGMAKADYNSLKKALTLKYGEPECVEQFDKYYKEDGYEFMHMKDGYVTWQSDFDSPAGKIYLYIKDQGVSQGCAIVQYRDKANSEKATLELSDEL